MKKIRNTFCLLLCLILASALSSCTVTYDEAEKSIMALNEKIYSSYDEIKKDSDIVAHITVKDELTSDNSRFTYYPSGAVEDFWSDRQAHVVKVYKNDTSADFSGDVIIKEHMGVGKDKICYKLNVDTPMLKNKDYIVFIKINDDGSFRLISQEGGKHNFTQGEMVGEMCLRLIFDYELTEKSELAEKLEKLKVGHNLQGSFDEYYPYEIIKTNFGDLKVREAKFDKNALPGKYYYEVSFDGYFKGYCSFSNFID